MKKLSISMFDNPERELIKKHYLNEIEKLNSQIQKSCDRKELRTLKSKCTKLTNEYGEIRDD